MLNLKKECFQSDFFIMIINQELKSSMESINNIEMQIKARKSKLNELKGNKPCWFQRKKFIMYCDNLKKCKEEIEYYYNELNQELKNIYHLDIIKKSLD